MLKKSVLAALVFLAIVTIPASNSHAFVGWRYSGWGGWRGSWGCGGCWSGFRGCNRCWGVRYGCYGCCGSWDCSTNCCGYVVSYAPQGCYAHNDVLSQRIVATSQPSREVKVINLAATAKTSLTLHVPADAKVTLAGVATKQTGETRQFSTSKLRPGELWDNYKVVVELPSGDQTLREERTIKLTGGNSQDLTVNFSSTQVVQR